AHFFETFLRQRVSTGGSSTNAHFAVYSFIGSVLHMHPLLGLGLNNFAVYYEFVTGKANFGAHSYWVEVIVDSGLIGLVLWIVFLRYVFVRLLAARRLGGAAREAARLRDDRGAHRHDRLELLLPDDAVLLFLRLPRLRARAAGRLRQAGARTIRLSARRRPHDLVAAARAGLRGPVRLRRRRAAAGAGRGDGRARARQRLPGLRARVR